MLLNTHSSQEVVPYKQIRIFDISSIPNGQLHYIWTNFQSRQDERHVLLQQNVGGEMLLNTENIALQKSYHF